MLDMQAQSALQGINYDRIFVDGSRHQIRLQITISRVTPIMREPRPGFSKERRMRNGNQQVPSRYSGFMANVRLCPFHPTRPDNDPYLYCSWFRQEHTLVRRAFAFFIKDA